ncbi:HDOD domain-containing protein [Halopseudomonas litoralis]|uniref:HDOD domain-containing protein n=1 Tax=Halopseudomonas litoralis TaxID=797277 RepID=A0A1H1MNM9_9GAMM|nr:HDOD domain-containing protein [Halopseudomonas litoralis]SDR88358.1 HDOD domain-containing protein [Halopseudomonas litoralis]
MRSLMTRTRSSLYWVEQQLEEGGALNWCVTGLEREPAPYLRMEQLQPCNSNGQWVVVEFSTEGEGRDLVRLRPLPDCIPRSQVERQAQWASGLQKRTLVKVWSMLAYIDDAILKSFLLDVLMDDQLMLAFCSDKASHGYHHNHVGGLLAHSYEVAVSAATLCSQHQLGMRTTWVAFIGGLLHDIGKVRMFYNDSNGVSGAHEAYSFMVLSAPLEHLRMKSAPLFEALTACLALSSSRHSDPYQVAGIVRMCDRLSAEVCNWRKAFERRPSHFWYVKSQHDGRMYKRLN